MGYCKFSKFTFFSIMLMLFRVTSAQNDDQNSLLSFKAWVVSDPLGALESWNNSSSGLHVCNWTGVKCDKRINRVVELDLSHNSLRGKISPRISCLSFLEILDLSWNFFEGEIPPQLASLLKLSQLSLSTNLLVGEIPGELGFLRGLVYLDLGSNNLSGEIPMPIFCNGSLSLEYMDLSNNSLSGKIPMTSQCELRELKFLLLWSNRLVGEVPKALANSSRLEWIDMESNSLSGELPSEIVTKLPNLQFLYLSNNHFSSHNGNTNLFPFFSSLMNSSNLQELELAGNHLGGDLPSIIGNLSTNLVEIHLEDNHIRGPIPHQISNLVNLTLLNLSTNLFNGTIPVELCRIGRLERLYLSNNQLSGEIPSCFGNVPHLGLLDLSKNMLTGTIPNTFANLPQLRRLLLQGNHLLGEIPTSLGQCINLEILDLSHNRLFGEIPSEVAGLRSLKLYLNLSSNHLHGPIPRELSKMDMVLAVDLSSNNLTATIPSQLGSCIALESLNLSNNIFQGSLPSSIGQLPYLKELDVSFNDLSGEIPQTMQASSSLKRINFSFNHFSGNVTDKGAFSTLTITSFLGNDELCGSIKGMKICHSKKGNHFLITILLSLLVTPIFCIVGCPLVHRSRLRKQWAVVNNKVGQITEQTEKTDPNYPKISHGQLVQATAGFSSSSLIGSGRFGQVYKGVLKDDTNIAVKVLDTRGGNILSSFKRECQVLKRTRHRNLVRIITTCSKPDFKALVFPLMKNGSLENHLYTSHQLDLVQLVNICSDIAEGVAYLHHHSPVKVVHCDLKPSNILLDDDMTALVTDFGIARLVKGGDDGKNYIDNTASYSSTDGLLCGSVGYIAPEYGMGKKASTQGDVYSYGVLLLEIVTGKRPTDHLFQEGKTLHEWVKSHYPHKLDPIVEEALLRCKPRASSISFHPNIWRDTILELIEVGLVCTQYNPATRPTMLDVALEIARLKQYLASPSILHIEDLPSKV